MKNQSEDNGETTHTPTPFSLIETATHIVVQGADGEALFCEHKTIPRAREDAAFIVQACNNHKRLTAERAGLARCTERLTAENKALRETVPSPEFWALVRSGLRSDAGLVWKAVAEQETITRAALDRTNTKVQ